jgi:hypothetical protein
MQVIPILQFQTYPVLSTRARTHIHPQVCDLRLMKRNADLTTFVLFLDALGFNKLTPFRK